MGMNIALKHCGRGLNLRLGNISQFLFFVSVSACVEVHVQAHQSRYIANSSRTRDPVRFVGKSYTLRTNSILA